MLFAVWLKEYEKAARERFPELSFQFLVARAVVAHLRLLSCRTASFAESSHGVVSGVIMVGGDALGFSGALSGHGRSL